MRQRTPVGRSPEESRKPLRDHRDAIKRYRPNRRVNAIQDLPISLAREERTADLTLSLISEKLSAKAGIAVHYRCFGGNGRQLRDSVKSRGRRREPWRQDTASADRRMQELYPAVALGLRCRHQTVRPFISKRNKGSLTSSGSKALHSACIRIICSLCRRLSPTSPFSAANTTRLWRFSPMLSVFASSKTPPFPQTSDGLSLLLPAPAAQVCCSREPAHSNSSNKSAIRRAGAFFCFFTPTISGETTALCLPPTSDSSNSPAKRPTARWPSSRTFTATNGISSSHRTLLPHARSRKSHRDSPHRLANPLLDLGRFRGGHRDRHAYQAKHRESPRPRLAAPSLGRRFQLDDCRNLDQRSHTAESVRWKPLPQTRWRGCPGNRAGDPLDRYLHPGKILQFQRGHSRFPIAQSLRPLPLRPPSVLSWSDARFSIGRPAFAQLAQPGDRRGSHHGRSPVPHSR